MIKRLAEIVIDAGLASREQVVRGARIGDEQRMPLIAVLVHHAGLDELALVAAIRRQVRVPLIDPALVDYDPEAMRELPQETCRRLRVMPLAISIYDPDTRLLRLAMADPTDTMAIAEVEHVTGCRVEGHLIPLSAVEELIDKSYRSFVTEVMRRAPTSPAASSRRSPPSRPGDPPAASARKSSTSATSTSAEPPAAALVGHDTHRLTIPDRGPPALHDDDATGTAEVEIEPGDDAQPSTVPFHRIVDEASLELRHQALLQLLIDKDLLTEDEYEEQIRLLMRRRDGDS
ncbi:hypothetical protein [Haliangium sp.]|uniref:GspE/PulE/PilB domain-containing protein n=1 Tax=Haliangium sp. TaxID=2663208 RepID=UPI003D0BCEF3